MLLARVIGNVVSTRKVDNLTGAKLLVVEPVDFESLEPAGKPLVAVDAVGAGEKEIVLVVQGSSARLTPATEGSPVDAAIMAIVEFIDVGEKTTYRK